MEESCIEAGGKKSELFDHIKKISEINKQAGGLNDLFFEFAKPHLSFICDNTGISQIGAVFFAALAHLYKGQFVDLDTLARYLCIGCIELVQYMDEFETLSEKNLIYIHRSDSEFVFNYGHAIISFGLCIKTFQLIKDKQYKAVSTKNLTISDLFIHIERLCQERVQHRQAYNSTIKIMNNLLFDNKHLLFVQKVQNLDLSDDDKLVLLRFFHYTVTMEEPEMTFWHLEGLYDNPAQFNVIRRQLKRGSYILLEKDLIENTCSDGFSSTESFRLTDSTKEEFLVELDEPVSRAKFKGLKAAKDISEKQLFYPENTQQAILELSSLLRPENFVEVQKRLSENSMRSGFACLFSGAPGTGKTETAYQVARACGRDIMQVDIASIKSKWFGDSEKQIKGLFDRYRACAKGYEITPILLFNEADAIISKRQSMAEYNNGPRQTENAIQNILLQEIEDLNGILIATTNLAGNMDSAFERRFLYKIEFEKPKVETRMAIWRSMLSGFSDEDAWSLAGRFDFSGGQIENIARKTTVHRVLSGKPPSLESLMQYCSEECYGQRDNRKIGFAS